MNSLKNILKAAMLFLPVILIIFLFSMIAKLEKSKPESEVVAPQEEPTATPQVFAPTRWATDSAVLEIEETVLQIEKELEGLDLNQASLHPPVLDLNVGF